MQINTILSEEAFKITPTMYDNDSKTKTEHVRKIFYTWTLYPSASLSASSFITVLFTYNAAGINVDWQWKI